MTKLLRDLIEIPERVTSGDYVLTISDGVDERFKDATIRDYVVTEQLSASFDKALGLIQDAVERRRSNAAYLDGSFGSGKSHFMAVLHAILKGDPLARGKRGLADIVGKHDKWLAGRSFLLVPYHVVEARSLEAAVLGGYVAHVLKVHPDKPLPAVFVDDELMADAAQMRADDGDQAFIAKISRGGSQWQKSWDTTLLDAAFAAPPSDPERRRLIGDLLMGPFKRYARAVRSDAESYISLDEGLSVISKHAKSVLGYDAVVLLLDELVLWLSGLVSDTKHMTMEAQKISKLVESAENERPAPIISFIPRQRDLKDLVGRDIAGGQAGSLFDTLNYWAERFNVIKLEDRNLPEIVKYRMLHVKPGAGAELDAAFEQTAAVRSQVWETLLDAQGGVGNRESFRATYPFSPAFLHAMVDLSSALQRQRSALRLMQQLLVAYRDVLVVGQLMPLGAIYDVLTDGKDEPFSDKLKGEFAQAQRFYKVKLRPYLLKKHELTEDQARALPARHSFRSDDLIAKTLLLAALVPGVPALRNLSSTRLAALNHGAVVASLAGREPRAVAETLRKMANEFGEIRVSDAEDPSVEVALIGVDTKAILAQVVHAADESAKRTTIKELLWSELGVVDKGQFVPTTTVIWRGTLRTVEVAFANVRDRDKVATGEFSPTEPDAIRFVIDYPFDEGTHSPAEDLRRVRELQADLDRPPTLVWLPHFLSADRIRDLEDLIKIEFLLDRDLLTDYTPTLSLEDRHHARTQLDNRRAALRSNLIGTIKAAYGIDSDRERDADLGARVEEHVLCLDSQLQLKPRVGQGFPEALRYLALLLLDHRYPKHPDFDIQGRRKEISRSELAIVLQTVEQAAQDKVGRAEVASNNVAVLKRIANPLKVGVMHEAAFVLGDEWKQLIDRRAGAAAAEVSVAKIRDWILEEQPGLPPLVIDLLVSCYAIQTDRAWVRGGQPQREAPELGKITGDLVLKRQELPSQTEWELASERAGAIFEVARPPVLSARAVQAVAADLRAKASEWLPAIEAHVAELKRHADTLGLDGSARLTTAQAAASTLNLLTIGDATAVIRALAGAKLPKESAIYRASLGSAKTLTTALANVRWRLIDQLPVLGDGTSEKAEPARAILDQLRIAAGHDEHEVQLASALTRAEQDAIDLLTETPPPPPPPLPPIDDGKKPKPIPGTTRHTVRGPETLAVVEELRKEAEANPDAEFEITWRIVR
ncbi:phage resistance protein [Microbispora sp. CA-102843]|uniref:phage resistance protein n=1 Tax=Microbispora sp. CA-102843 TaxID=3239952 RepID=UPI003D8DAB13